MISKVFSNLTDCDSGTSILPQLTQALMASFEFLLLERKGPQAEDSAPAARPLQSPRGAGKAPETNITSYKTALTPNHNHTTSLILQFWEHRLIFELSAARRRSFILFRGVEYFDHTRLSKSWFCEIHFASQRSLEATRPQESPRRGRSAEPAHHSKQGGAVPSAPCGPALREGCALRAEGLS